MEFKPGTAGNTDTSTGHFATQLTGNTTGEAIDVNQPVEVRSDGRLFKTAGASSGTFLGVAVRTAKVANQAMTLRGIGQRFHARDEGDLVPGKTYYLGATAGYISDAATAKDSQGAFVAVSGTDLMVVRVGKLA